MASDLLICSNKELNHRHASCAISKRAIASNYSAFDSKVLGNQISTYIHAESYAKHLVPLISPLLNSHLRGVIAAIKTLAPKSAVN